MYSNYPQKNKTNKKDFPSDNYEAKAKRKAKTEIIKRKDNINNESEKKFQNTKTKIKEILFKNGFILNNGHFRDINIPENKKFIQQVQRGVIPHELLNKGIDDLGILLENRKDEEYITTQYQPYIQGNQNRNTISINQNIYMNNLNNNINVNNNKIYQKQNNNNIQNLNPSRASSQPNNFAQIYKVDYYSGQNPINEIYQYDLNNNTNNLNINKNKSDNSNNQTKKTHEKIVFDKNNVCLTPIGIRGTRKNIFPGKDLENHESKNRKSNSGKKKETKNFRTFGSWIREEKAKEEEMKKKGIKIQEEKEVKKFVAFEGEGFLIDNVNVEGLHVNKDIKNSINKSLPICNFNIRLFNGEIIKCEFNYNKTLRDVYAYVKKLSGSNNFILLEGFPPRPLNQLNKSLKELNLENTTLTQKIN